MFGGFFQRPGVQSSEFKVLTAAGAWLAANAGEHWTSLGQALAIAAPALVYALSRGFAKTEPRGPGTGAGS